MKKHFKIAVALAGAAFAAGCSSGYPSTKDRVENVERTMRNEKMTGDRSEVRDNRFFTDSGMTKPTQPDPVQKK
ncbi:MAG: hypothetical protein K8T20_06675 [Planctomycetes bacterium]|nr:hypothetical protein [Planctomycetota bacterium]